MQRRLDGLKTIKCKLREHPSNLKLQKLWKIKAKVLAGKWEKNWNNKACSKARCNTSHALNRASMENSWDFCFYIVSNFEKRILLENNNSLKFKIDYNILYIFSCYYRHSYRKTASKIQQNIRNIVTLPLHFSS